MELQSKKNSHNKIGLILLVFIAFIALGLPDGLIGVAWPSIRRNFSCPIDSLGQLLFAITAGYLFSSFFSGKTISKLGVGKVLAISCALTGACLAGYTFVPYWGMMIILGVITGLGAGAIDAGLNTYVAANFGERLMQWLHACWGIGVTISPVIMTAGLSLFNSWRWGYLLVGIAQIILGGCFLFTFALWQKKDVSTGDSTNLLMTDYKTPYKLTIRKPAVWLSISLFFFYTGVEATLGYWIYTLLTESRGILPATAGLFTGSYWAIFTIGRILAGFYTKHITTHTLILSSVIAALVGALLLWWNPSGIISLAGTGIIGFALAPVFPGLVSGTSSRVTIRYAANTIGMQMGAAGLGIAVLPALAGVLARHTSLEIIPLYLIILTTILLGLYLLSMRCGEKPEGETVLPVNPVTVKPDEE